MATNNFFPDGFPKDPYAILDFIKDSPVIDNLGDEGVEGWVKWLDEGKPSQEDIEQFVNIVHDLWIEEGKDQSPKNSQQLNSVDSVDKDGQKVDTKDQEKTPEKTSGKNQKQGANNETSSNSEAELVNPFAAHFIQEDPVVLTSTVNTDSTNLNTETKENTKENTKETLTASEEKAIVVQDESDSYQNTKSYTTFDVNRVRETATREELNTIYKQYLDSKEANALYERSFFESQSVLFDKMMSVIVNFEQVADYFESMTEKLLDMNEKIVQQGRDQQSVKTNITARQQMNEDKLNLLEGDVARMTIEFRDYKVLNNKRYEELLVKSSYSDNNTFSDTEVFKQRLDILDSKITKVINHVGMSGVSNSSRLSTLSSSGQSNPTISKISPINPISPANQAPKVSYNQQTSSKDDSISNNSQGKAGKNR